MVEFRLVVFPDPIFHACQKKWVLETAYFIFIKLHQNDGALVFSNLLHQLDGIEDYIPHYVPMIC